MKKLFVFLCVSCLVLLSSSYLMAGGVDNRSNLSGEYVGSLNRNAATDSLDAIAYNPAGVMKMENGTYGNLSVHYVTKDYTNIVNGVKLEQDKPSLIPALFALYKKDDWAGFFSFTIPSGGGKVDYKNGSATSRTAAYALMGGLNLMLPMYGYSGIVYDGIENESVKAEGVYYGVTLGGAYKINDKISVSLAGRYIDANKKARAAFQLTSETGPTVSTVMDYEDTADGVGFVLGLGLDLDPVYIGMRYETETNLGFKYNVKEDAITGLPLSLPGLLAQRAILDGLEHDRNLPALFSLGLAYTVSPKLKIDTGLTYYFQESADWGGAEQNVDDGYEMGISLEYAFRDNLKGTIGYLNTKTGMEARYATNEAPELDATSFGLGIKYKYSENLKMDFGVGYVSYDRGSYNDSLTNLPVILDKEVTMIAAGAQYSF